MIRKIYLGSEPNLSHTNGNLIKLYYRHISKFLNIVYKKIKQVTLYFIDTGEEMEGDEEMADLLAGGWCGYGTSQPPLQPLHVPPTEPGAGHHCSAAEVTAAAYNW